MFTTDQMPLDQNLLFHGERLSIDSEKPPFIWPKPFDLRRMVSSDRTRSAFFAQPGKAKPLRFLAKRTRLDITIDRAAVRCSTQRELRNS